MRFKRDGLGMDITTILSMCDRSQSDAVRSHGFSVGALYRGDGRRF